MRKVVSRGTWLYDEDVEMPVLVVETDFDFWYDIGAANGDLEPDETPSLNADGKRYYVCFRDLSDDDPFWPSGTGHLSAREAEAAAQLRVPSPISWSERMTGPSSAVPGSQLDA